MHVNDLLKAAVERNASDLHLKVGSHPVLRVNGDLLPLTSEPLLTYEDLAAAATTIMPPEHQRKFKNSNEVDLAYSVQGLGRFRCNVFQQRSTIGIVIRVIPWRVKTVDELMLPPVFKKIAAEERGLVLVTGTTGSGKSSSLASMIDFINGSRPAHVITIE